MTSATAPALPTRFARLVKIEHTVFALPFAYVGAQQLVECIAAPILARSGHHTVRHGQHRGPQATRSFVFSTSCTSPITMSLSIALAMS